MENSLIIAAIIATFAILIALIAIFSVSNKSSEKEKVYTEKIEIYENYLKTTDIIKEFGPTVYVFGPRYAGKTSLAWRWATPWEIIRSGDSPSPDSDLVDYQFSFSQLPSVEYRHPILNLPCKKIPTLSVKMKVYPGEVGHRDKAMEDIRKLKPSDIDGKFILMFVFATMDDHELPVFSQNRRYFYAKFLADLKRVIDEGIKIDRVLVVHQKADLVIKHTGIYGPGYEYKLTEWLNSQAENMEILNELNRFFGQENVKTHVTSTFSGLGLPGLLKDIVEGDIQTRPENEQRILRETVRAYEKVIKERERLRE